MTGIFSEMKDPFKLLVIALYAFLLELLVVGFIVKDSTSFFLFYPAYFVFTILVLEAVHRTLYFRVIPL